MTEKPTRHYDRPLISPIYENLPGYGVDLFVGGREGASDLPLMKANGITTVLNCAVNLDFNYVARPDEVSHDSRVGYGPALIRYYKLGIVDGPGNPETMMLAGYYQLRGALDQVMPDKASYPLRERGNVLVNCRAGRSRSVVLVALFLHLHLPKEFPRLADAIDHVRIKRELRSEEWHETPKPMLIAAAERTARWVGLVEADRKALELA
ncbi:dual specificity protein phosphatase family protein (plasmid) [Paracoccus denitrificans]|uniref:dual specificity protein phosphatase family protein n=1 Tax=Paracoccus denitrificans TaxID=266 RepID=UPI001E3FD6B9|nr:dual specificity protein phosphatase [Paracoccus denitrificans]UFS68216.1 dual specificity protein phosphatase family protein [Paracoccus denitrificans]